MGVRLRIRATAANGKRTYRKPNKTKFYPDDTVFCLRYSADGRRRWETLDLANLNAALAARATNEAALLSALPAVASAPAKRINVNDAMATYLSCVEATRLQPQLVEPQKTGLGVRGWPRGQRFWASRDLSRPRPDAGL
jgi:hypothetical protein